MSEKPKEPLTGMERLTHLVLVKHVTVVLT